eukprot:1327753-Amorphochlora_amoeboformis.AAC.1
MIALCYSRIPPACYSAYNPYMIPSKAEEDYWAAVKLIDRYPNHKKSFSFHLLYCYYQLKQNDKAMKIAQGTQDKLKTKGFWHVQAQL